MLKIAHIINPVKVPAHSDLHTAQPITFESMRKAAQWGAMDDNVSVQLLATQYPEDREIIPDYIHQQDDLTRSILDEDTFSMPRKLPLLADILNKLLNVEADFLIYTNVDIGLMPHFYQSIARYIEDGYDALIVNRRTVPGHYSVSDLSYIYAELGEMHQGYDCFIFSKEILPKLKLGKVAIGAPGVGLALFINLVCLSSRFKLIANSHLTFHIGNDRAWDNDRLADFRDHNRRELNRLTEALLEDGYAVDAAMELRQQYLQETGFVEDNQKKLSLIEKGMNFIWGKAN